MKDINYYEIVNLVESYCYLCRPSQVGSNMMFHYTNLETANLILNNGQFVDLWHMKHADDPQEHKIEEIKAFYLNGLKLVDLSKRPNLKTMLEKIDVADDYIFFGIDTRVHKGVGYMCCFTITDNNRRLLNDVEKEHSGKGTILPFYTEGLFDERRKGFDSDYKHHFVKVIYQDEDKISKVKSFIDELIKTNLSEGTIVDLVRCFFELL